VTRRLRIIARFGFGRRNVSDRLQQSLVVEPVDPFERGDSTASKLRHGPRRCSATIKMRIRIASGRNVPERLFVASS
jgi:hypothetical protein